MIVFASFEINKEKIVAELCVEKDLVVNECQGQCHLNKVLNEVNDNNEQDDQNNNRSKNIELEENVIPYLLKLTLPIAHKKNNQLPPFIRTITQVDLDISSPPPKV